MNPAIFREYDVRGIAERDFDSTFARDLGRAFGTLAREHGARIVSVGRDARLTSPSYAAALADGLSSTGLTVLDLGMCPTPLVYFSLFHWQLDGGIQVTGSHNPTDYNGFKLCLGTKSIYGDEIQDLRRRMETGRYTTGDGTIEARAVIPPYQAYVGANIGRLPRTIKAVVDAGNGAGGPVAPAIYRAMGVDLTELYCEPDGRFPHHHPDPTVEENMQDLVRRVAETEAEIGIAFDGDADRIGVVDAAGRVVWGDELLILFARDVLARNPGATIVSEVKCSQRLYDDVAAHGGHAIMWKAGHSLLKAKMRETGALLGGEMSGHIFFKERYFGFDDAVYAGARLLEILGRSGKTVSQLLADLPPAHSTPEIRVDCPDALKFRVADEVRNHLRAAGHGIVDIDGVRAQFPHGWGLVRASNTQPILVLRFEAETAALLTQYQTEVEAVVRSVRTELDASIA